jgi:hypothetical protein
LEKNLAKLQNSTEESAGTDETQYASLVHHSRGDLVALTTALNRISRKVLNLKRKLKVKKTLGEKDVKVVNNLLVSIGW